MITRKFIMIGMRDAGKTSLVRRVVLREFDADYLSTLGVDIYTLTIPADRLGEGATEDIRLTIWDTQGEIGKRIFTHAYFQGAAAIGIVGDASDRGSLEHMLELAEICDVEAAGRPCVLICNKVDLLPPGTEPEFPAGFEPKRWPTFRASAKDDINVTAAFNHIARAILDRRV